MKQTPKTDSSGFCLQQLKKNSRELWGLQQHNESQWNSLPSGRDAIFSPFVLGCFLHSSFHLYVSFVTELLKKKRSTSHHQQSANYTGNELRKANILILREMLILRETFCSSQQRIRPTPRFWERVCQVKAELFPMWYIQPSVKSPQITFNDSPACSKHLKYHLTEYETKSGPASRWPPPRRRLGQPRWPPRTSCSSLHLFQFHSVPGGILLPWARINEMFSPPWFSLPAVHFCPPLCSFSQSDPPKLLCAHFLSLPCLSSLPTSDSPHSKMLLLPAQNPGVAPLPPAITPGSPPCPPGQRGWWGGGRKALPAKGCREGGKPPCLQKYWQSRWHKAMPVPFCCWWLWQRSLQDVFRWKICFVSVSMAPGIWAPAFASQFNFSFMEHAAMD